MHLIGGAIGCGRDDHARVTVPAQDDWPPAGRRADSGHRLHDVGDVGVEIDAAGVGAGAVVAQARQGKSVHRMPEAAKPGGNRLAGPSATPAAGNQNESCHWAACPFLPVRRTGIFAHTSTVAAGRSGRPPVERQIMPVGRQVSELDRAR